METKCRRALPGETEARIFSTFSSPLPCGASAIIGQVASRVEIYSERGEK